MTNNNLLSEIKAKTKYIEEVLSDFKDEQIDTEYMATSITRELKGIYQNIELIKS